MHNRDEMEIMLRRTCAMWDDPEVYCYQNLELPREVGPSIFLAGPTSREGVLEYKWRAEAVYLLRQAGFPGPIFVPEARENDWGFRSTFPTTIVQWESERLLGATLVVFWLPRHPTQLPGRVTNMELGFVAGMAYADPAHFKKRFVWGYPPDAWKVKSEAHWVQDLARVTPFNSLGLLCEEANSRLTTL